MAGDGPVLSAFAARKRLLARTSAPGTPSAAQEGNGSSGSASGTEGPRGSDAADDGAQRKRASRRRKRPRVEAAAGAEQEQEGAVGSGDAPESTREASRRTTPKSDVAEEPAQSPAQTPMATAPRVELVLAEEANATVPRVVVPKELGAISDTPSR